MAGTVEQKLAAQGVVLHEPASPVANYVGSVRTGNLLFVSGQVCVNPESWIARAVAPAPASPSRVVTPRRRGCATTCWRRSAAALGDLYGGPCGPALAACESAPDFLDGPKALNGASDLMVLAFGDKGRHARTTVGVSSLPSDAAVEVEGVFEVS